MTRPPDDDGYRLWLRYDLLQDQQRRAEYAEERLRSLGFEILSPAQLGVVCFRAHPAGVDEPAELDALNERINARVNATGRFLMSSTRLRGRFSLRLCTQVHRMTEADIDEVIQEIVQQAALV